MKKILLVILLAIFLLATPLLAQPTVPGPSWKVNDEIFGIYDDGDSTKWLMFEVSGLTTNTTRTATWPDKDGTVMFNVVEDLLPVLGNWLNASGFDVNDVRDLTMTGEIQLANTKDIYWHDGGVKKSYIEASNSSLDLAFRAINDLFFWGSGEFNFYADDDDSDFVRITTSTDQPYIQFVGCDGRITADGGDLVLGSNLNLETGGTIQAATLTDGTASIILGVITGATNTNWDAAYNDKINSAAFNTGDGVITLTQQDAGTVTVDIDGRYVQDTGDTMTGTLDLDAQLDLTYTYDAAAQKNAISSVITNSCSGGIATGAQTALNFQSVFAPTANWAGQPDIFGCYGLGKTNRSNCTGTVDVLAGYYGSVQTLETVDGGAITINEATIFRAGTAAKDADDTITTLTGIYVAAQTVGGTNYAIYTAGADSDTYLEGDISAEDVVDRAQWSTWKGTPEEALGAVLLIDNKDHNTYPVSIRRTLIEQKPTGEKQTIILPDGTEIEEDVTEPSEVSGRSLSALVTLLTEATKEQQKQIDELEARVSKLESPGIAGIGRGSFVEIIMLGVIGIAAVGYYALRRRVKEKVNG